jgi:hypothetical protein
MQTDNTLLMGNKRLSSLIASSVSPLTIITCRDVEVKVLLWCTKDQTRVLLDLLCFIVYMVVCFVCFYLILCIMYSFCYVYVFLLLCMFRSRYSVSLCCSVYCLCVNVYYTTATGCQPNCR